MKRIRQLSKLNELFDKGHSNYDVNLGHVIFLLTSNSGGEEEIKKAWCWNVF